ncbi:MAG: site-2 protease family protein [Planctomycetota bacterium]
MATDIPIEPTPVEDPRNEAVLAEIGRQEKKSPGWVNALLILGVSVALFVALGAARWSWEFLLLLLPILFLHELGHYVAMRLFRYRNVRMFFIPLFGAAVSGQHYNVAGWKKTIVSLMGPLPGLLLAAVAGVAGLIVDVPLLIDAAVLALILNGLNLLPILPLDGGWVMHSVIFSRHYVLDAGFRVLAVAALILGAALIGDYILLVFGILMLMGLPTAFRLSRVVETLKSRGVPAASADAQSIPPETAGLIVEEVRRSFPASLSDKNLATITVQAFEAINARPPGCLASLFLAGVHLGAFLFALVFAAVFVVAQHVDLGDFLTAAASAPQNPVDVAHIETRAAEAPDFSLPEKTLVATFRDPARAKTVFDALAGEVPPEMTLVRFGQSLLLSVPGEDDDDQEQWKARLARETINVRVANEPGLNVVSLLAIAPNEEAAARLEEALSAYFTAGYAMNLIPPWHPDLRVTPEHERARQMYARLVDSSDDDDPKLDQLAEQVEAAHDEGNEQEAHRLEEQLNDLWARAQEAHLEELASQTSDPSEREVIALFRERPLHEYEDESARDEESGEPVANAADPEAIDPALEQAAEEHERAMADWHRRMGEPLGQLPREGDEVKSAQRRFSARGAVTRTGLIVQINYLTFDRLVDGPAAIVRWLDAEKCVGMKYDFNASF